MDCFFFKRGGYLFYFIQNGVLYNHREGVPAADFGDTPQAGSKRGRPFDFSCSIHLKYGHFVNENLRKFERFLRKVLEKRKNSGFSGRICGRNMI